MKAEHFTIIEIITPANDYVNYSIAPYSIFFNCQKCEKTSRRKVGYYDNHKEESKSELSAEDAIIKIFSCCVADD